jgi:GT2 family glycosyltransferase
VTATLSAIVVNYRSAALAARCVASLAREIAAEGWEAEILLVDSASGAAEAAALAAIPHARRLLLAENRGYAGGVNAGLARASGELVLVSNPDVEYAPGSLGPLAAAARDPRVGAAGPAAFWDAGQRLRMPPGFAPGFGRDLAQYLAGRVPALDDRRFAAFAREALGLWAEGGDAAHLNGFSLMARRSVFARVGGFDESYAHEFEETDWEERALESGLLLRYVPAARVTHLWGGSSRGEPEPAEARRASARRLYRRRRFGRLRAALLEGAAKLVRTPAYPRLSEPRLSARAGHWVGISPNASGIPFAGAPLEREFRLPEEIAGAVAPGPWFFTVFSESDGRPAERHIWERYA